MNRSFASLILLCAMWLISPAAATAVTIAWSPVGNPGNAADTVTMSDGTIGYGAVGYTYKIDKYDVTASQYVEFLNAKDPSGANTLGLYNSDMSNAMYGGISFTASNPSGSKYSIIAGRGNHPVSYSTWYDAIRFANWLNNGQGNGDTETGAYTLGALGAGGVPTNGNSIGRNAGAKIFLPSENEWYKAAYYNPVTKKYFQWPTRSDTVPLGEAPPGGSDSANYGSAVGNLTDVGAYTGTKSPYGAFDMGGNLFQWNDTLIIESGISYRGLRGGAINFGSFDLLSTTRSGSDPSLESRDFLGFFGFRVASVPEPSTLVLLGVGAVGLLAAARRRRRTRLAGA